MRKLRELEESLLDEDGSCRDLNFEDPTWQGAQAAVVYVGASFGSCESTDDDGKAIEGSLRNAVSKLERRGSGHVHVAFGQGADLFRQLQLFVCVGDNGAPFVEVTFFPGGLARRGTLREDFVAWADGLREQLEARRYYVRYENASWRIGDSSQKSGVFFAS